MKKLKIIYPFFKIRIIIQLLILLRRIKNKIYYYLITKKITFINKKQIIKIPKKINKKYKKLYKMKII